MSRRQESFQDADLWPQPSPSASPMIEPFRAMFYQPATSYPPVRLLGSADKKRILVTGGAGFVGSHLVDRLLLMGHEVTVLDNYFSGAKSSLSHWVGHPNFEMVRHDVTEPFLIEVDQIYHLACPASPTAYQYNAIKTMKTNFMGTMNMLGLAKRVKARFLLSSTSEVYGSPEEHPQTEEYWGKVNPIGPRACYDEGKRVAEALTYGYQRQDGVDVRVARIFNTFGPRMSTKDGRVVSNFVNAALKGDDLTIYGDGKQSRSLQYVHDLVDGLILLMNSETETAKTSPINLGTSIEKSITEWAEIVINEVESVLEELNMGSLDHKRSSIIYVGALPDDPPKRRADSTKARRELGWQARFSIEDGIRETCKYFIGSS